VESPSAVGAVDLTAIEDGSSAQWSSHRPEVFSASARYGNVEAIRVRAVCASDVGVGELWHQKDWRYPDQ
jgi:hypothetical protein